MAYPKGAPKPANSGRKKGVLNRKTEDLMAKCEARGIDVFDALLEYVVLPSSPEIRLSALKELCQYLYPKRKALEVSGELNNPYLEKPLEELKALVKKDLEKK